MLEKLGLHFRLIHLNEGHAAFALLERIRDCRLGGLSFDDGFPKGWVRVMKEAIRTTDFLFQNGGPESIGIESDAAQMLLHITRS
jgi:hypothetical protein